jgi:BirA family biotin operon repressor/biotin-[acetyl-CoA-carboxylase] ligase
MEEGYLPDGTVVVAQYQGEGRGLDGNNWESEKGKNLLASILLYPVFIEPSRQFALNMVVSVAILKMLDSFSEGVNLSLKWPNDVFAGEHKIAGVLIRHSVHHETLHHSVIGVGVNLNQKVFVSDAPNPVSLVHHTKREMDVENCLEKYLFFLNEGYGKLAAGKTEDLEQEYLALLYRKEGWHRFEIRGETMSARIAGIDEFGQLMLMDKQHKLYTCGLKEVKYLPDL